MLDKFKIAETDQFSKKIMDVKYSQLSKKIINYVYPQLKHNPYFGKNIKKLKGELEGVYRYRIGDFRLFYEILDEKVLVIVFDIDARKDAY